MIMLKRLAKVIFIIIFGVAILFGYYFLNLYYGFHIPCLLKKFTGYYCSGCGITRCLFSIIEGNYYEAFCYNRLVFLMLPFIFISVIYIIYLYVFNRKDKVIKKIPNVVWFFVVMLVVGFGVIRNIDFFSYLQP